MRRALAFVSLLAALAGGPVHAAEPAQRVVLEVQGKFDHVKDDLVNAVIKRGLVIDYTARIGAMLDRTAKDVGATKTVYARAEAIQFCSATLSRRMIEADPANIVHCPYVIAIYALARDPGTIHVAYRRPAGSDTPAGRRALREVDALLGGILRETVAAKGK